MSEHNDGGPAFPRTDFGKVPENGMSVRTYIATEAMAALIVANSRRTVRRWTPMRSPMRRSNTPTS